MHLLSNAVRSAALAALSLSLLGGIALASDNKIAVAPGPVTQKLEKALAAYVREYVEARHAARGQH